MTATHARTTAARSTLAPIPFRRLVSVEARKLFDTRTGTVLTVLLVLLALAGIVGRGVVVGPRYQTLVTTAGAAFGILLPVLGILTVTGEWSHRTALTTFVLEPRRARVLAAKCLPALGLTVAACAFALLAAVPVTAVVAEVQGTPATWEVAPLALLGWVVTGLLVVAMGLAIGMALLHAPTAIAICLSAPLVWGLVSNMGSGGAALAGWLDLGATTAPLMAGQLNAGEAARLAVSVACWIAVPMALGALRVIRADVR